MSNNVIKKVNLYLPVVNTIILVSGAVLGYFLIERQQLSESKSNVDLATSEIELNAAQIEGLMSEKILNELRLEVAPLREALSLAKTNGEIVLNLSQTELNKTSARMAELELQIKEANARIDSLSRKTAVSIDLSKLVNDIQPILDIACSGTNPPSIEIDCSYTNRGGHKVYLGAPVVELLIIGSDKQVKKDTYTVSNTVSNVINPGISGSNKIYVSFPGQNAFSKFVVKLNWDASLHSSVRDVVEPLLSDIMDTEFLDNLMSQGYSYRITYSGGG